MADQEHGGRGKLFQLRVISPERIMFDASATALTATATEGMLGVLSNHAPLVTPLMPGTLQITSDKGEKQILVAGEGFLEVFDNQVRVLVDSAELPDEIDTERAQQARQRAEERLARPGLKEIDYARAEAALCRAMVRLRTRQGL